MARKDSQTAIALLMLLLAPIGAVAQVTETPIAFDSAGKVRTLTPGLVARFDLRPPAWPVQGPFVEARLYSISTGGRVLSVDRPAGTIDRYAMTDDLLAALRTAVDAAMSRTGTLVTEEKADVISEPARGAFIRNQMFLTWALYAPLLASLTNDVKAGTVIYLGATGASYFVTTAILRKTTVTRAQNHLTTDGAVRGAATAAGLLYAAVGDSASNDAYSGVALAGALAGTIGGFHWGRRRTDSEAEATTTISNLAALTAFGIGGVAGGINEVNDGRGVIGGIVGAGIAGYALGPSYPRRARYAVTRGDVEMLWTAALLGAAVGVTPFIKDDPDEKSLFGSGAAGLLAGTVIGDRVLVRGFDYSAWDATQVNLGVAAGGLLGGAILVLTETDDPTTGAAIVVSGALLGAVAGHKLANPARAGGGTRRAELARPRGSRLQFDASAAAFAAAGVPGRHALLTLRF